MLRGGQARRLASMSTADGLNSRTKEDHGQEPRETHPESPPSCTGGAAGHGAKSPKRCWIAGGAPCDRSPALRSPLTSNPRCASLARSRGLFGGARRSHERGMVALGRGLGRVRGAGRCRCRPGGMRQRTVGCRRRRVRYQSRPRYRRGGIGRPTVHPAGEIALKNAYNKTRSMPPLFAASTYFGSQFRPMATAGMYGCCPAAPARSCCGTD
jgi:hypothetical protein